MACLKVVHVFLLFASLVLLASCGSNDSMEPISTSIPTQISSPNSPAHSATSHRLWSYSTIQLDVRAGSAEIIPLRVLEDHFNVVYFLETKPCVDCVKVTKVEPSDHGTVLVDVRLTHPFPGLQALTGFDVRGIVIFDGSKQWPGSGLTMPDLNYGDPELINPDGHTSLYNFTTEGAGINGYKGYIPGSFASDQAPDGLLNGFIRYSSDDPGNTRNAFYSDDSITRTFDIALPGSEWLLGYAVDASWDIPTVEPVENPIEDFPIAANCTEAWKVEVTVDPIGIGLNDVGGKARIFADFYDWQGPDNIHMPVVECPELFEGQVEFDWEEDFDGFTRYEAVVENDLLAPEGEYRCLISKEAAENDPGKPWLDQTAYFVQNLKVAKKFDLVDITPPYLNFSPRDICIDDQYAYIAGGDNGFHVFDITKPGLPFWTGWLDLTEPVYSVAVSDGYIFATNGADGIVQIQLNSFGEPGIISFLETEYDAHGVDAFDGYVYVATSFGLEIINIDTLESWLIECGVPLSGEIRRLRLAGDYAFIVDFDGIHVFDVNPVDASNEIQFWEYPDTYDICLDGEYAYIAQCAYGLRILKLDEFFNATDLGSLETPGAAFGVDVKGYHAYVADSRAGLTIFDLDPPEAAFITQTIETSGFPYKVRYSAGYAYIADMASGLAIVDIENSCVAGRCLTPGTPAHMGVLGDNLYTCDLYGGLQRINVALPEFATVEGFTDPGDRAVSVRFHDQYAYTLDWLSTNPGKLHILDMTNPDDPVILNTKALGSKPHDLEITVGYAFINSAAGFYIQNVDPPENTYYYQNIGLSHQHFGTVLTGGYAYVAGNHGLFVVDIDPVEEAHLITLIEEPSSSRDIALYDGYLVLIGSNLYFYNIDDPESPELVYSSEKSGRQLFVSDGYLFAAGNLNTSDSGNYGLKVYSFEPPDQLIELDKIEFESRSPNTPVGLQVIDNLAFVSLNDSGVRIVRLW